MTDDRDAYLDCTATNGIPYCDETLRTQSLDGYKTGATMNYTAIVTATTSLGVTNNQTITVQVRDVGGVDDDTGTGTGTEQVQEQEQVLTQ